jgi:hypothetical protein
VTRRLPPRSFFKQINPKKLFTSLHFRLPLLEAVNDCAPAPERKLRVVGAGANNDAFDFEALLFVIAGRGGDVLADFLSASALADTGLLLAAGTRCATVVFVSDEDCKIPALTFCFWAIGLGECAGVPRRLNTNTSLVEAGAS